MGQKKNPIGVRLSLNRNWNSVWYADKKQFSTFILIDAKIRELIHTKFRDYVSKVVINRFTKKLEVLIYSSRVGLIIGKKGEEISRLTDKISHLANMSAFIEVKEIKNPDVDAAIIARQIALNLEKRQHFRKVLKRSANLAIRKGAIGVKIVISGRIAGSEIARSEKVQIGRTGVHTFANYIDYCSCPAMTTTGIIGVKVWVNNTDTKQGDINAT